MTISSQVPAITDLESLNRWLKQIAQTIYNRCIPYDHIIKSIRIQLPYKTMESIYRMSPINVTPDQTPKNMCTHFVMAGVDCSISVYFDVNENLTDMCIVEFESESKIQTQQIKNSFEGIFKKEMDEVLQNMKERKAKRLAEALQPGLYEMREANAYNTVPFKGRIFRKGDRLSVRVEGFPDELFKNDAAFMAKYIITQRP